MVLSLLARADLRAISMKEYSAFPKAPALLEPQHQIVLCHIQDTCWEGVLPLCGDAVGVFYSPSRLGHFLQALSIISIDRFQLKAIVILLERIYYWEGALNSVSIVEDV